MAKHEKNNTTQNKAKNENKNKEGKINQQTTAKHFDNDDDDKRCSQNNFTKQRCEIN